MLIARGRYVWTGTELLADAAVVCKNGKVDSVGAWSEVSASLPGAPVVGGPNVMVLPGLINAHHHGNGITSFMRGVLDDCLEPWLAALGSAPAVDPYWDTLWAAVGLMQGGYTTVVLFQSTADPASAYQEARARIQACRDAGLRVAFGLDLIQQNFYVYGPDPAGLPPRQGLTTEAYLTLLETLRREYAADPGVTVFPAPSGHQWVTDEAWERIGAWSLEHSVPLHTHCLESPYEAEYARRAYGGSVVAHLDKLGALHRHTSLIHGVYLSPQELARMAERGASLITNPSSNLRLRCGVSPVLGALAAGVNVALGTDACAIGEEDDAFAEVRRLLYLQRTPGMDTPALTWQQAFAAATTQAATVTPWGSQIGVIAPGAWADLSLFDLQAASAPWVHPHLHPLHVLVHRASARHLAAVIVEGKVVWDAQRGARHVNTEEAAQQLQAQLERVPLETGHDITDLVRSYYRSWDVRW